MSKMRCINCQKSTKGYKQFCGNCGTPIQTPPNVADSQNSQSPKAKKVVFKTKPLIAAISLLVLASAGIVTTVALTPPELSLNAKILMPNETTLWLDEPFKIQGLVQSNIAIPKGYRYELLDIKRKTLKSGSIALGVKSFEFSSTVPRMEQSALFTLKIFSEKDELELSIESKKVYAVTTSLPNECDLPTLESNYGGFEIGGAPSVTDQPDPSTFYCQGDTVGSWMNETFIGIGPQVNYSDWSYFEPSRDRYKDWLESAKHMKIDYGYVESSIEGYPVVYECYVPNPGDAEVISALINVHGVQIDYWNEGCLDDNSKFILEAVANVPVKSLK